MSINLLKRMESSVHSIRLTVNRVLGYLKDIAQSIKQYQQSGQNGQREMHDLSDVAHEFDEDDQNTELIAVGKKVRIDLADMDCISWERDIGADIEILEELVRKVEEITPEWDSKLRELVRMVKEKAENPINPGNRKVLIFTAFADTAKYIYENVAPLLREKFGLSSALITGTGQGKTNIPKFGSDINHILTCFSPKAKDKDLLYPDDPEIDVLIATDCISEGQDLQDCVWCINYDIHWNPVRIIQRFGRIDRIGSPSLRIQLANFWPDIDLDEYINLRRRVEARMRILAMASTGDDDLINADETGDLEYRKQQLQKLQHEVVDIEDMSSGVLIMDLGLNEFRTDLLAFAEKHKDLKRMLLGVHAIVTGERPGVLFVLKNLNGDIGTKSRNRLHPYYVVFASMDGEIIVDHLHPKKSLDILRLVSQGKSAPDKQLCA